MKVLLSWMRESADLPADAELVAHRLTHVGIEVEERRDLGRSVGGVVVAEIRKVERHPGADRLSVCTVWDGARELRVVCGAQNVRAGALGALAHVGAALPGGRILERAEIRGVVSEGMLCSEQELGLAEKSHGVLLLERGQPGEPLARALGFEDDALFTLALTPNRPDCLSHVGAAREAAAALAVAWRVPEPQVAEAPRPARERSRVDIEDPERCPRYAARLVEGVQVGPSPAWLRRRLELCGVRSINNVVDATNYVLLELGHPLHAFDLDKLAGQRIVVRRAREGEPMTTLDGERRTLCADDLVIADAERPQALAGVMGGIESEVGDRTTRLLLESAYFEARGIRRTARRHGLHTEASHRFERGADPEMVTRALDRVAALIADLAGGEVLQGTLDAYPAPIDRRRIRVDWSRASALLGVDVRAEEGIALLGRVGVACLACASPGREWCDFEAPPWRPDLERDVDLYEEIARLRGYDRIPSALPLLRLSQAPAPRSALQRAALAAGDALAASGLSEAVNFSFVSARGIAALRLPDADRRARPIRLRNPISEEMAVLRTSLLPGLLMNAAHNERHGVGDVHLFEVGRVFWETGERLPEERWMAAGVRVGRRPGPGWDGSDAPVDFHDAKGAVEQALAALGIATPAFERAAVPYLHPRAGAEVRQGGHLLGVAGEVHPRVSQSLGLEAKAFAFEIDLGAAVAAVTEPPRFRDLPRFPSVYRDMAVVVDAAVTWQSIRELVLEAGAPIAAGVRIFDVYTGKPVPEGKKSVAFAITYQTPDRTLTDEEVGEVHERIRRRLDERLGARIRE